MDESHDDLPGFWRPAERVRQAKPAKLLPRFLSPHPDASHDRLNFIIAMIGTHRNAHSSRRLIAVCGGCLIGSASAVLAVCFLDVARSSMAPALSVVGSRLSPLV